MIKVIFILVVFAVGSSCGRRAQQAEPVCVTQNLSFGTLHVDAAGSSVRNTVTLPVRLANTPQLVFVVEGTDYWYRADVPPEQETMWIPVRISIELNEVGADGLPYTIILSPTNHMQTRSWSKPYAAAFAVRDVAPFTLAQLHPPTTNYMVGLYHHGTNVASGIDPRLIPGRTYTFNLTVMQPVSITNHVTVWLWCLVYTEKAWSKAMEWK